MTSSAQQPMIVKYLESLHNGIQSQILSRYAIGYILRGTKYIYDGDKRQTLSRGDVFYLGIGHHYIENVPEGGQPYEEVLFYYTPGDLQRILMHLNITYGLNIRTSIRAKTAATARTSPCPHGTRCATFSSMRTTICATRSAATTRQARASR